MQKKWINPILKSSPQAHNIEHQEHFSTNLVTNASVTILVQAKKHSIMLLFSSAIAHIKMYLSNAKFNYVKERKENDGMTEALFVFQLLTDNTAIP